VEIKVKVPDGVCGDWAVETFVVTKEQAELSRLRALMSFSHRGRPVPKGRYKRLMYKGRVIMSNTPAEIDDHYEFIYQARVRGGAILINGLGLGVCLTAVLDCSSVTEVTVVEKEADVIKLVGPTFERDPRVKIIHDDALTYRFPKGKRYTTVWHDIWEYITEDNLPEMHRLHRRYGKHCDWQGSWGRQLLGR